MPYTGYGGVSYGTDAGSMVPDSRTILNDLLHLEKQQVQLTENIKKQLKNDPKKSRVPVFDPEYERLKATESSLQIEKKKLSDAIRNIETEKKQVEKGIREEKHLNEKYQNYLEEYDEDMKRLRDRIDTAIKKQYNLETNLSKAEEKGKDELWTMEEKYNKRMEEIRTKYEKIVQKHNNIDKLRILCSENLESLNQHISRILGEINGLNTNFRKQWSEINQNYIKNDERARRMHDFFSSASRRNEMMEKALFQMRREARRRTEEFINELD